MALLQVRDFPKESYELLSLVAKEQKRSITQQAIFMLETQLLHKNNEASNRRKAALDSICAMNFSLPKNAPSANELIQKDRNGSLKNGRMPGNGRLR